MKHPITNKVKYPELLVFADVDGDGRDEMVGSDDGPGYGIRIYEIPDSPREGANWTWTTVDTSPFHGLGVGDLNGDGRLDLVSDFVWFEQLVPGRWTKHPLPVPTTDRAKADRQVMAMQIEVSDADADGDQDIILTRAHNYGDFWLESVDGTQPEFTVHEKARLGGGL